MPRFIDDRYVIIKGTVVAGGQGTVHKAIDSAGNYGDVAVKLLSTGVASALDERLFYERELQALQRLENESGEYVIGYASATDAVAAAAATGGELIAEINAVVVDEAASRFAAVDPAAEERRTSPESIIESPWLIGSGG